MSGHTLIVVTGIHRPSSWAGKPAMTEGCWVLTEKLPVVSRHHRAQSQRDKDEEGSWPGLA